MLRPFRLMLLAGAVLAAHAPAPTLAAPPAGVAELLRQAEFWSARGRHDIARRAAQRVLAIDPNNAQARRILSAAAPRPSPAPSPAPARPAAKPEPAADRPAREAATPGPAPRGGGDPGGAARAEGFAALEAGNVARAAARFEAALAVRPNDPDALGGLGIARLRAERFAEARDLLTRASRLGSAAKWAEALRSASFFADLRAAEKARDENRLAEAEAIARRLAGSGADEGGLAQALLGDVLSRQGRHAEAAAAYAATGGAGGAQAADVRARAARARALDAVSRGDAASAERQFQSAIVADPGDPWMRYEYARFLVGQGRTVAAIATMEPLNNAATPAGLFAAALFNNQIGRGTVAAALMERIPPSQLTDPMKTFLVELQVGNAVEQARRLQAGGRTLDALEGLRAVASRNGLPVGALAALAQAFDELGATAEASDLALRATQAPPGEPEQYKPLMGVLARTGQSATAGAIIQQFAADPSTARAAGELGATLAAAEGDQLRLGGQLAAAFDVLQRGWGSQPGNPEILAALARLYQTGGMNGQAAQVYAMLLRQKPDDTAVLAGLADAAAAAGDHDTAGDAIQRMLQVAPDDPETYLAAARVEDARGRKGNALRYLRQAQQMLAARGSFTNGAFPAANPFAQAPAGPGAQAPAAVNPFALPTRTARPQGGSAGGGAFGGGPQAQQPYVPQAPALPGAAPFGGTTAVPGAAGAPYRPYAPGAAASAGGVADPTMARINEQIAALTGETGPAINASTSLRDRSGEAGLSKLTEIGAEIGASTTVGAARLSISAKPVVVDAGSPSRSATARFGRNPTAEAEGIVAQQPSQLVGADTQHDSGVALSVGVEAGALKADVGTTPLGFSRTSVQGGVSFNPRISPSVTVGVHAEYRPVTDSVLSYAGTVDPVTGAPWGSVMRGGGGGSFSYDRDGSGIYADVAYHYYRGRNVRRNNSIQANIGGYINAYRSRSTTLTVGANLNYQQYGNNQNYFTFGHGGYFSPQSFVALAFPVRYSTRTGGWQIDANAAPGYQSFQQDSVPIYPTLPDAQAQLDLLKLENDDVRARFDSLSESGFAFSGSLGASYRLGPATTLGGEVKYDSFGVYNEFQTMLRIRQSLGGKAQ